MPDEEKTRPGKSGLPRPDGFLRYTGMASQMAVTIVAGVFVGQWADGHFGLDKPYLTGLCAVLAVFVAMWLAIKDLIKK